MKNVFRFIAAISCLHLAAAYESSAAVGYTSLNYSGALSGYSQTWMDPFNTIDEQCQTYYAYGQEWFDCYVIEATGVTVEGQLVNPNSTIVDSDTAYDWFQATVYYGVGAPVQPGTWTAAGSHSIEANGHAYYCLPFQGCGDYPIGFMNMFLGYSADQEEVQHPCASGVSIAAAVINEMSPWSTLAFERGATVVCSNDFPDITYRRDSFNEMFTGTYDETDDPCKAGLVPTNAIAGLHSHPLFAHEDEMNRGKGCHGGKAHVYQQIQPTNIANEDFTAPEGADNKDHQWGMDTDTDLYLLVPEVDKIKRLDPTNFYTFPVWSR